jgi:hypothetical protein
MAGLHGDELGGQRLPKAGSRGTDPLRLGHRACGKPLELRRDARQVGMRVNGELTFGNPDVYSHDLWE